MYIAFDPEMREGEDGQPAIARNSDIVEDLGMVRHAAAFILTSSPKAAWAGLCASACYQMCRRPHQQ